MYNLVVNTNSPLVSDILNNKDEKAQKHLISQAFDLAKLSQNLLHGEEFNKLYQTFIRNDQIVIWYKSQ